MLKVELGLIVFNFVSKNCRQIAYYTGPTGTDQPLSFLTCLQYMVDDLHFG